MAEGAERQILKFIVPRSPKMTFSDSSVHTSFVRPILFIS